MALPSAVLHISNHILDQLSKAVIRPLFVALQGPQGSGKSFLANLVRSHLSAPPHALNVVVLSIDDLYLTHEELVTLAQRNPDNPLWRGRGQPGTHDVELGSKVLRSLKEGKNGIELPRFDKSLFDGEGDRLHLDGTGTIVDSPVDVFIMEGWFMGFYPVSLQELQTKWDGIWAQERQLLGLNDAVVGTKNDIADVNEALKGYMEIWEFFDTIVKIEAASSPSSVSSLSMIYKWRLEQEHDMKARNGGKGMTDEAVKLFVDRYIPGYIFFGDGIFRGYVGCLGAEKKDMTRFAAPRWLGRSLRIGVNEKREVVAVEEF
ncbi:MAG: P-loop containing nucleoside triphosphate hydrolase protein [Lentinula lateritia]|uniref:P-loop containing nucleoside triphosphate hydrolase protein n=1 Tax=Lentinula lateritia TaxID=40482 RepID=A0ABQ8VLF6_9AGAR|nr:MAG: P-loop containing nucleoside triphosphate hydrolase protein [Lentinula lateritia]KAJ4497222.1 P-loop containing nucleoside triphosphate hydrolase protein [Lentinula lateritia]